MTRTTNNGNGGVEVEVYSAVASRDGPTSRWPCNRNETSRREHMLCEMLDTFGDWWARQMAGASTVYWVVALTRSLRGELRSEN